MIRWLVYKRTSGLSAIGMARYRSLEQAGYFHCFESEDAMNTE